MEAEYRGAITPFWLRHKAVALKNQIVYDLHKAGYNINRRNVRFHVTHFPL
jgi:repressor of nif and glnA expression